MTIYEAIKARDAAVLPSRFAFAPAVHQHDSLLVLEWDRRWLLGVVNLAEPLIRDYAERGHAPGCIRFGQPAMGACDCGCLLARKALHLLTTSDAPRVPTEETK